MPFNSLLVSIFNLLANKARDEAADKLQNGDVANEGFRKLIQRDLHDIKTKLDNLSKINLCSSFDYLEEGFLQLFQCFDEVQRNKECSNNVSNNDDSQAICIATRYKVSCEMQDSKLFELAKESFKESHKKATDAFNNENLTLEHRIVAIIVKVIVQIFECPEHPKNAINLCLTYIKRLHQLKGVQEMFSVHIGDGLRARLKRSERKENMKSVILLNRRLYQFIARINNNHDHLANWPSIDLGEGNVFNPMCDLCKIFSLEFLGTELIHSSKEMEKMKAIMFKILEEMTKNEHVKTLPSSIEGMMNSEKEDILIAGGSSYVSWSVEIFSWKEEKWCEIASMKKGHWLASSFIYNDKLFVVGGDGCKSMETLNIKQSPLTWRKFPAELPYECRVHQTVVYKQQILFIGGHILGKGESDLISEINISGTTSYVLKELCHMPEQHLGHGAVVVDDKVLIFGGHGKDRNVLSSVLEFDPRTLTFQEMPPLPHPLTLMATVQWRDQVVLLGGNDGKENLNSVIMYDSKTGKITVLPSMLEKRKGCCAVSTGDTIVVMGGKDDKYEDLNSVECFKMGSTSSWTYLPSMNEPRYGAIAEVLPFGKIMYQHKIFYK